MVFYDMVHSNNAARIRIWLMYNKQVPVQTRMITYNDLKDPEYEKINPFRKVPALIRMSKEENQESVFESSVILNYLEYKYNKNELFIPECPEQRQLMDLMIRCHDLYVASPNCTMPGFSHSQGAMYLAPRPTVFCPPERCMDRETRAKKVEELWKQLCLLNSIIVGPYLTGDQVTLADFTWYPTIIFMEFMLPRVFGWKDIFYEDVHLPKFSKWFKFLSSISNFAKVRQDIWTFWEKQYDAGQFVTIKEEIHLKDSDTYQWSFPIDWKQDFKATLIYQKPSPQGKICGRYIKPSTDDMPNTYVDENELRTVTVKNGRTRKQPPSLETTGFVLIKHSSSALYAIRPRKSMSIQKQQFLKLDEKSKVQYQEEIIELVKLEVGCKQVFIYDYIHETTDGKLLIEHDLSSIVHCNSTAKEAQCLLQDVGENLGISANEMDEIINSADKGGRRFALINVWRSIHSENPVIQRPLALSDATSIHENDRLLCLTRYPDRIRESYRAQFGHSHQWFVYPKMTFDECLIFKSFDSSEETKTKFVFRADLNDPRSGFKAEPRKSIEVRMVILW